MTKYKAAERFFFGNLIFDALDSWTSLQTRYFQARIAIDDNAIRRGHQWEEKASSPASSIALSLDEETLSPSRA